MPIRSGSSQWKDPRQLLGLSGEQAAIRFLERAGWVLLHHRFKMGRLEIDIVARRERVIAFVEVKTRRGPRFGSPFEAVTWSKRREITRVARAWVDRHGRPEYVYRFDVIGITAGTACRALQHMEDAFRL